MDQPVRYSGGDDRSGQRRALYVAFTVVVVVIVGLGLVEGLIGLPVFGVTSRTAATSAGGTELSVEYQRVTRGQLDSPISIEITRQDGFDGPVAVVLSAAYFDLFSVEAIRPDPASETSDGETWTLMFDQPEGVTLTVDLELVARPVGWFDHATGSVLIDTGDATAPEVTFVTDVRP